MIQVAMSYETASIGVSLTTKEHPEYDSIFHEQTHTISSLLFRHSIVIPTKDINTL